MLPYQKFFYNSKLKITSRKSAPQQSINWIKFIKWYWQYYSRGRSNSQENPTVDLPEVSRLIDSAISRRPKENKGNTVFLRKKYSINGKMDLLWTARNITALDGSCYKAIDSSISQNILSYLKMFSMQCRKIITVEDNKKRMNMAN